MANLDAPFGFRPHNNSCGQNTRAGYTIASAYGTAIYPGDPVKLVSGSLQRAAAGDAIVGIFAGCTYVPTGDLVPKWGHWPASQAASSISAQVYDEPDALFEVQVDGGTLAATDVGKLADCVAGAGSTPYQKSGFMLSATAGTGAATFRILEKVQGHDNEWGADVKVVVQVHEHAYSTADDVT